MAVFQNNLLAGAGAQSSDSTYKINQSIRFDLASTTYMQRTHGAGGNVDKSTVSFWFKRSTFGVEVTMFGTGASVYNTFDIYFKTDNTMVIQNYAGSYQLRLITNQVFRDPSAWYHVVFVYDSANGNSTDRAKLYINGQRITSFGTATYPSQNQDSILGSNVAIGFGRYISYGSSNTNQYFPGYLAEMNYVNGQALTPDSFGETNSSGIWVPKEYEGSYGTGGFHIDGRDASDLGDDESGNGNDMTTYGLAAHDQVADSPTNNFCTFNSLDNRGTPGTLSEGALKMAFAATNDNVTGTQGMSSGKWYWEAYIVDNDNTYIGVQDSGISATGYTASAVALWYGGFIYENNSDTGDRAIATSGAAYSNGDVVGVAFDADNKKIWWSKNGQWYTANSSSTSTINISEVEAGNSAQVITRSPDFFMPFFGNYTHSTAIFNFGQEGTFSGNKTAGGNSDGNGVGNFFSAVPSGFLALCTKNLGS